ncbi:MAG: dTDP-glucose 4,6-dehydratase [Chloroflexi bacterium]|nr:dTDP-glucose 4,6-dehydratase [Chloroflexota bacterium]
MKRVLITGGAGFIGSNYAHYVLGEHPHYEAVILDKLTYAGNMDNLKDLSDNPRYRFIKGDICDPEVVNEAMSGCNYVVNFAAETHVDRSIVDPGSFITTDVYGTHVLLEAARRFGVERFLQVSTDEVYGSVLEGFSNEQDSLHPSSPYSASKAGGELMARAYHTTYGLPVVITRGSNTYGPYQYPEKLIPLFVTNALDEVPLPVYGDGLNRRDWIYVLDHCAGIDFVLHNGEAGEIYNVGGGNEHTNMEITRLILELLEKSSDLITYVKDRPGHDRRYALDCGKLQALGWSPAHSFQNAMAETVKWYLDNRWWWEKIKSGEYARYYEQMYGGR